MRRELSNPPRLMITAFGWNDAGGGTLIPRLAAKEFARRGWDVTVFHAAVNLTESLIPYELREWDEDGVRLIGVHNRMHGVWDLGHPVRELNDPLITEAFAEALDRLRPDVVHFHNLHNLGAALMTEAAVRGLPSYFTTHNYWLLCPRAYLLTGPGAICEGPGDGGRCAACVGSTEVGAHQLRLASIRAIAEGGLSRILAVSDAVRHALLSVGYPADAVDVVRQAIPNEAEIWEQLGRHRVPGLRREHLTVAFLGSAYPHKGPRLLVEAAQLATAELDVRIIGEIDDEFEEQLRVLDSRGVVSFHGRFQASEIGTLLEDVDVAVLPSMWWDCAPLAAAECLAARVPVVVPRLGGLPEAVQDGVDGLVFTALDATDLARQLDRLATEPGLLERLQTNIGAPPAFADYIDEIEAYYRGERSEYSYAPPLAPALRWRGDHGLPTSLSIINDEITKRLPYPVQRVDRGGLNIDPPLPHPADIEVRHQWPPDFSVARAGRLAVIVPWEFGAIPAAWKQKIDDTVDELWVPSEYVRQMYLDGGVDSTKVHVVANGVDLETFRPRSGVSSEAADVATARPRRFLYVGGINVRKGIDLLIQTWDEALGERDDVVLVVKAAMAGGAYGGPSEELRDRAAQARLPRVELVEDDLDSETLAELYRSCDIFVLPYRGEGFAMPVLEAMASGLPVIVTAGGPTDEFCPPDAGWRIRSSRQEMPKELLSGFEPDGTPWMLEPDRSHLVELLREAADAPAAELAVKGQAGRRAAEGYSWDAVAEAYSQRIAALAASPRPTASVNNEPFPLTEEVQVRVLATPAWRGSDQLGELLREWSDATQAQTSACLYLLADPGSAGSPEEIEASVLAAAERGGADLEDCADINVLIQEFRSDRDERLHGAVDAYVPLHAACDGHVRMAATAGSRVLRLGSGDLAATLSSL
jgi:glycosyltransferase involved in cell wall biosynthesis